MSGRTVVATIIVDAWKRSRNDNRYALARVLSPTGPDAPSCALCYPEMFGRVITPNVAVACVLVQDETTWKIESFPPQVVAQLNAVVVSKHDSEKSFAGVVVEGTHDGATIRARISDQTLRKKQLAYLRVGTKVTIAAEAGKVAWFATEVLSPGPDAASFRADDGVLCVVDKHWARSDRTQQTAHVIAYDRDGGIAVLVTAFRAQLSGAGITALRAPTLREREAFDRWTLADQHTLSAARAREGDDDTEPSFLVLRLEFQSPKWISAKIIAPRPIPGPAKPTDLIDWVWCEIVRAPKKSELPKPARQYSTTPNKGPTYKASVKFQHPRLGLHSGEIELPIFERDESLLPLLDVGRKLSVAFRVFRDEWSVYSIHRIDTTTALSEKDQVSR